MRQLDFITVNGITNIPIPIIVLTNTAVGFNIFKSNIYCVYNLYYYNNITLFKNNY